MDTDLSTLFVKRFGVGSDLAMPNVDAVYIRALLEEGSYKEACEKLIDYYGENSVTALNWKIHDLKDKINQIGNECDDLRRSNEAEHCEKVKFWEKAEQAARLLKEFVDLNAEDKVEQPWDRDSMAQLRQKIDEFLDKNKELLP